MYKLKFVSKTKNRRKALLLLAFLASTSLVTAGEQGQSANSWIRQLHAGQNGIPAQIRGVDELFSVALANNSELQSQYAEWQMRMEEVKTVVGLPDPNLAIGYFVEPVETAQGPQQAKISFTQTIPWMSKTKSAIQSKKARVDQAFDVLNDNRLKLKRDVAILWSEAAFLNEALLIQEQKIALSKDLEEVLNIQYQSASISHEKLFDTQIQTLLLVDHMKGLKDRKYRLNIKLSALLEVDAPLADSVLALASLKAYKPLENTQVENAHPRLKHLSDLKQETIALKHLAQAEYFPDFRIGLEYILTDKRTVSGVEVVESGRDPLVLSAGISLPIWNWRSKKAGVKASEWRETKIEALINSQTIMLNQEYELSRSKLGEDLRKIALYTEQLIPKALEVEQVMEQAYISQSADISTLTMVRQKRLEQNLSLLEAQLSAAIQMANVTYLEGE